MSLEESQQLSFSLFLTLNSHYVIFGIKTAYGERQTAYGERQTAYGEQRTANGGRARAEARRPTPGPY